MIGNDMKALPFTVNSIRQILQDYKVN